MLEFEAFFSQREIAVADGACRRQTIQIPVSWPGNDGAGLPASRQSTDLNTNKLGLPEGNNASSNS